MPLTHLSIITEQAEEKLDSFKILSLDLADYKAFKK